MDTREVHLQQSEDGETIVRYGKCVIGTVSNLNLPMPGEHWGAMRDNRLVAVKGTEWAAAYALATWCGY